MFSAEQMNKASSGSVPLSKRYRYPQAPVQAPNQMYQQQPNVGMTSGYGYQQPQGNAIPQSFGQPQPQPQQQYPGAFNPYGQNPNANVGAVPMPSSYQAAPPPPIANVSQQQPQQYSQQYAPSPPLMAPNAYANAYTGSNPNQPSQMNYNAGPYAGNPGNYNAASQFPGQQGPTPPPPMNYQQSQQVPPYNSQARY